MTVFLNLLLQNSLSGTALILGILLFRKITGNLSKFYVRILWLAAFLVLLLPPVTLSSFYTLRNLIPDTEFVFSKNPTSSTDGQKTAGNKELNAEANISGEEAATPEISPESKGAEIKLLDPRQSKNVSAETSDTGLIKLLFILWALGATTLIMAALTQWLRLKTKISTAVQIRRDVWSTEIIDTPFVMPGLPSRIYIPQELEKGKDPLKNILNHERRHIQNGDPWIKCFSALVSILHWFNPFVWIAFCMMNRDMEMYCDECVLRGKTITEKKYYAQTLLDFACKSKGFSLAIYFGESSTKSRIWHILHTKRPHAVISLLLLLMISGCGLSFLTAGEEPSGNSVGNMLPKDQIMADIEPEIKNQSNTEGGSDEEVFWTDQDIVGIGHQGMTNDFDEAAMSLINETEHFSLYSMEDGEAMVVRTPECLVYAQVPVISNYDIEPMLSEQDFDGDGEAELAMITYVLHGTGISIRSLFMVDHTADSSWKIYQYRDQDYLSELNSHIDTAYEDSGVRLLVDEVPTGAVEQVEQEQLDSGYQYYAGSQIDFSFAAGNIFLQAQLTGHSDISPAGLYTCHELDSQVRYLGEGRWELTDIRYADAGITEVIREAIPLYLTGHTSDVLEHFTVPGLQLESFPETSEEVTIVSITYPTEDLDSGQVTAYVALLWDEEDSFYYLSVPLRRVEQDARWLIAGELFLEK
ncbi:MAG: M56 family metallopeptidase [Lachnospiraceae bacterium]|nr:M56 family metallopeptidase [Lachnospiraceae bacterium]